MKTLISLLVLTCSVPVFAESKCNFDLKESKLPEIQSLDFERKKRLCGNSETSEGPIECYLTALDRTDLNWNWNNDSMLPKDAFADSRMSTGVQLCAGAQNVTPIECYSYASQSKMLTSLFPHHELRTLCVQAQTAQGPADCLMNALTQISAEADSTQQADALDRFMEQNEKVNSALVRCRSL